jgi:hypothetical protein
VCDTPLDRSRAHVKIWEKRAQHPSDDRVFKVVCDWLPSLNQQQSQDCDRGVFGGFFVSDMLLDDLLACQGLRP